MNRCSRIDVVSATTESGIAVPLACRREPRLEASRGFVLVLGLATAWVAPRSGDAQPPAQAPLCTVRIESVPPVDCAHIEWRGPPGEPRPAMSPAGRACVAVASLRSGAHAVDFNDGRGVHEIPMELWGTEYRIEVRRVVPADERNDSRPEEEWVYAPRTTLEIDRREADGIALISEGSGAFGFLNGTSAPLDLRVSPRGEIVGLTWERQDARGAWERVPFPPVSTPATVEATLAPGASMPARSVDRGHEGYRLAWTASETMGRHGSVDELHRTRVVSEPW